MQNNFDRVASSESVSSPLKTNCKHPGKSALDMHRSHMSEDRFYRDASQYIPELNVLDCLFREDWFKAVLGIKEVRQRIPGEGSANSFDEGKLNYWQLHW